MRHRYCFVLVVKKVKVSHNSHRDYGGKRPTVTWASIWEAEPIPLLLLPYLSLIGSRYPFTVWSTENLFQSLDSQAWFQLTTFRRFLHHNWASLTIQLRRLLCCQRYCKLLYTWVLRLSCVTDNTQTGETQHSAEIFLINRNREKLFSVMFLLYVVY